MNKNLEHKNKQDRRTHEDVLYYQQRMLDIVSSKIQFNDILNEEEKKDWLKTISYALMSWGVNTKVFYDTPSAKIPFGDVHAFSMHFLTYKKQVKIHYKGNDYMFDIKDLWELLFDYLLNGFGKAEDQAMFISKEASINEQWSGYEFSSKRKLGE